MIAEVDNLETEKLMVEELLVSSQKVLVDLLAMQLLVFVDLLHMYLEVLIVVFVVLVLEVLEHLVSDSFFSSLTFSLTDWFFAVDSFLF